jgi:hypothetical protein
VRRHHPIIQRGTHQPTHPPTHLTSLTSSPRAATSVATSTEFSSALKRSSAFKRCFCCMPAVVLAGHGRQRER